MNGVEVNGCSEFAEDSGCIAPMMTSRDVLIPAAFCKLFTPRSHQMSRINFRRTVLMALLLSCVGNCGWMSKASAQDSRDEASEQTTSRGQLAQEVGRIKRNTNSNTDAPYSLVDKWGTVRYYIQPGEGMDLEPFLNRVVRVQGDASSLQNESVQVLDVEKVSLPEAPQNRSMPAQQRYATQGPRQQQRPTEGNYRRAPARTEQYREFAEEEYPHAHRPAVHSVRTSYQDNVVQPNAEETPTPAPDRRPTDVRSEPMHNDHLTPIPQILQDEEINLMPNSAGCGSCQGCRSRQGCSQSCCDPCRGGCCPSPGMVWIRAEYLYWWTQGMHLPPMVSTGPDATQPGFLGSPGTQVLFGGNSVNGFGRSGVRLTAGMWLNPCQTIGVEADYFGLVSANTNFFAASDGNGSPIISRPFFDTRGDLDNQNVEIVSSPGILSGSVSVNATTSLQSAGIRGVFNLCCKQKCYDNSCFCGLNGPGVSRFDFLLGYRYMTLNDGVNVHENLNSLLVQAPGNIQVNDSFVSQNQFHGVEIGTRMQKYRGRWSMDLLSKVAIGNVNQVVVINGATAITPPGGPTQTFQGGLLAQTTNIGRYSRNDLGFIPELGANLGYQLTPRLRATFGYTFMYWGNVARAGEQIDFNVNSNYLARKPVPSVPFGDPRHPLFAFNENSFWAQGISTGLDLRW
jgi:hypothetical protein